MRGWALLALLAVVAALVAALAGSPAVEACDEVEDRSQGYACVNLE